MMSPQIFLQRNDAVAAARFRTGVSLHSHTLHSRESLDFIYAAAAQAPILSAVLRRGEQSYRRSHGSCLDLSRGWWTPPLGAHDAWLLEKRQIEGLDRDALVSLTDHDDIEAPVSLQVLDECRGTPISVEWTVPFGRTFFHLGVHNLPPAQARAIWAEIGGYRRAPGEERLGEMLAMLASLEQVLVVFNHPLWDEKHIGRAAHQAAAGDFIRRFGGNLHALELNGLRPWRENRAVAELAQAAGKPVISGGDRHAIEPNAVINLTNADNFDEFVEEIRSGWSTVLVLRHYEESFGLRVLHNMIDVLRTYEQHANGWRLWRDRVFYTCDDGRTRSLTELFGERPPIAVKVFVGTLHLASRPHIRRILRGAFQGAKEVRL